MEREYRAWVVGVPTPATLKQLRDGVDLGDGIARARAVHIVERGEGRARLAVVLTEGRKREVRRLMRAVGHPVRHLARVRFGTVELGDLAPGCWRELTEGEVTKLRALAGAR